MSLKRPTCAKCELECECYQVGPFATGREDLFSVIWQCPRCDSRSLVVSPLGPLLLAPAMCLNCGRLDHAGEAPCPGCGFALADAISPGDRILTDEVLLQKARECFALGTCRRGLTIINFVLQRNPQCQEAWSIKGQFLGYLGFPV